MPTLDATQKFVPIKDIRDGIVILKNGQLCSVLLTSSINFALKSTTEQRAILAEFQSFLNTLDFSIQIYVQSRDLDIEPYLEVLSQRERDQDNDLMRIQLREYIEFIRVFTREVDIMTKNFFIVVPYTPLVSINKGIKGFLSKNPKPTTVEFTSAQFAEYRIQLEQRIGVVEQGLSGIGIRTIPLDTEALIELYYHIFNPLDTTKAPKVM